MENQNSNPNKIWTIKNILIIIGLVVIIAVCVAILTFCFERYYLENKLPVVPAKNSLPTDIYPGQYQPPVAGEPAKEGTFFAPPKIEQLPYGTIPVANTKVLWNKDPVKLSDLKLILGYRDDYNNGGTVQAIDAINYYRLGSNAKNEIIMAMLPAMDMGGQPVLFFEKNENSYIFMQKMSNSYSIYDGKGYKSGYVLAPVILSADANTFYEGIAGPENITWKGIKLKSSNYYSPQLFNLDYKDHQFSQNLGITTYGQLYLDKYERTISDYNFKFYSKGYVLKLPNGFYTNYTEEFDFFSDNYVPGITWNNGEKNTLSYNGAKTGGCGSITPYISYFGDISSDIKITGTTKLGENIYEFKDIKNPVVEYFYDSFGGMVYNYTNNSSERVSIDEWFLYHPVIIYKNILGEYLIFTNSKYSLQAECAKSVIYLYPEKTTNVKVKVGAKITKSEPEYNNGWQVTAKPDGIIVNSDGKIYDSLFWDGIGSGVYPDIKEGFIVRLSDIENALKLQLSQLGLNEKESKDFMEFWIPKMPKNNYVRLTWFTTSQVNQLAPLSILPKPDTIIRIFLDFKGLDKPINLPKQKLTSLPRKGFTVVEWGGLLVK